MLRYVHVALSTVFLVMPTGCELLPPVKTPEVGLSGIALESLGLTEQVFRARLLVSNPNSVQLKINNAAVTLEMEGIDLGTGETLDGISVPANGQGFVDVRIVANLLQSAPQLWSALNAGNGLLDYRVNGIVNLGPGGLARLRIDESGQLDANRLLGGR